MDKIGFLSEISLFSHMKEEDLKRIAAQARVQWFQPGEVIIREGERDRRLFMVMTGQAEVIKGFGSENEKRLVTLGPRAYFGEMALIDDLARSATVVAKTEAQVLHLEHLDLHKEIERSPAMAFELLQMLSRRLRVAEKFIVNTLGSFLPICANCKKIRDEEGAWIPIEAYISDRSETEFSHGICPDCMKKLYPEYYKGE